MRILFPASLVTLLVFSACVTLTPATPTGSVASSQASSVAVVVVSSSASTLSSSVSSARFVSDRDSATVLTLDGSTFAPSTLRFKKGQKAIIELRSDQPRGFFAPMLNVVVVADSDYMLFTVPTAKAGTFDFWCNMGCDGDARGVIVIE